MGKIIPNEVPVKPGFRKHLIIMPDDSIKQSYFTLYHKKMKYLLILTLLLTGCLPDSPYRRSREALPQIDVEDKKDIMNMIGAFDDKELVQAFGCGGYFGLVAPDYVISLPASVKRQSGERTEYVINGRGPTPQLYVYEANTADLPRCDDVGSGENTLRGTLMPTSGRFTVYTRVPGKRKKNDTDLVYVKIHELVFPDSLRGYGDIIIENKVLWGVYDRGAAG